MRTATMPISASEGTSSAMEPTVVIDGVEVIVPSLGSRRDGFERVIQRERGSTSSERIQWTRTRCTGTAFHRMGRLGGRTGTGTTDRERHHRAIEKTRCREDLENALRMAQARTVMELDGDGDRGPTPCNRTPFVYLRKCINRYVGGRRIGHVLC